MELPRRIWKGWRGCRIDCVCRRMLENSRILQLFGGNCLLRGGGFLRPIARRVWRGSQKLATNWRSAQKATRGDGGFKKTDHRSADAHIRADINLGAERADEGIRAHSVDRAGVVGTVNTTCMSQTAEWSADSERTSART